MTEIVWRFLVGAHSIAPNVTTSKEQAWGLRPMLHATNERVIPRPKVLTNIDESRLASGVLSLSEDQSQMWLQQYSLSGYLYRL